MRGLSSGLIAVLVAASLAGCATTRQQEPEIQRISAEELERIMPRPVPNLSLAALVELSRSGTAPDAIIEQIKTSNSQYDLSPSQTLELSRQGVDVKVLDYIHSSREQAVRDSMAEEINKRELENQKEQKRLQREYQLRSGPYYAPYFGYGYYPYWRYSPFYGYYGHGYRGRFGYGFGW